MLDLGEHVYQCHGPDDETEEDPIVCYICGWKVDSKGDLMKHRKEKHIQHVRICLYFEKGNCDFDAEDCWYQHKAALPQTIKEFKCSLCGDISKTKPDLMKHRKIEHTDYVSTCSKSKSNSCHFGAEKCWYKHQQRKNIEEVYNENPEIITRMFDMMEKFTERFEFIENQL